MQQTPEYTVVSMRLDLDLREDVELGLDLDLKLELRLKLGACPALQQCTSACEGCTFSLCLRLQSASVQTYLCGSRHDHTVLAGSDVEQRTCR